MKKNISKISLDLLSRIEKNVLFKLEPFFKKRELLSGGTALMLQLPFRRSYDFDLFIVLENGFNLEKIILDAKKILGGNFLKSYFYPSWFTLRI